MTSDVCTSNVRIPESHPSCLHKGQTVVPTSGATATTWLFGSSTVIVFPCAGTVGICPPPGTASDEYPPSRARRAVSTYLFHLYTPFPFLSPILLIFFMPMTLTRLDQSVRHGFGSRGRGRGLVDTVKQADTKTKLIQVILRWGRAGWGAKNLVKE